MSYTFIHFIIALQFKFMFNLAFAKSPGHDRQRFQTILQTFLLRRDQFHEEEINRRVHNADMSLEEKELPGKSCVE